MPQDPPPPPATTQVPRRLPRLFQACPGRPGACASGRCGVGLRPGRNREAVGVEEPQRRPCAPAPRLRCSAAAAREFAGKCVRSVRAAPGRLLLPSPPELVPLESLLEPPSPATLREDPLSTRVPPFSGVGPCRAAARVAPLRAPSPFRV